MELRSYQHEAIQSVYDSFTAGNSAPLIAMPTGTGKSLVIAGGIKRMNTEYPSTRHLVLTHVKELIAQNSKKLLELWPQAPAGVYSAGLNRRDTMHPIVFGGCASVVNSTARFGHRDILWIDEAHLVSPSAETTYQKIIEELRVINPALKIVGLTATHYRRGQGLLTNGGMFDDICIDLTDIDSWQRFISEGHLVPPIPKKTDTQIDISEVKITAGDFNEGQLQHALDQKGINLAAAKELIRAGVDRRAWLIFCSGVDHAEHMAAILNELGVPTAAVHARLPAAERDARIAAYKSGALKCLTNNNVLTTGFDHPPLDMIGMLRPTVSTGLWVQMLGRGTRPAPGKKNCLVLDFAGNTARLGPINDPRIPNPKGKSSGDIPVKLCEACGAYNHISARVCEGCGAPFEIQSKLTHKPGSLELLRGELPVLEWFKVTRPHYQRHERKSDGAVSIRIQYMCGSRNFDKYITFDNPRALVFAKEFWAQFVNAPYPENNDEALKILKSGIAIIPKAVKVHLNRDYPTIVEYEF